MSGLAQGVDDIGQDNGIRRPVGLVRQSGDAVSNAMHRIQPCAAVGHRRIDARIAHADPCLDIVSVLIGTKQILGAKPDGFARKHHGQAAATAIARVDVAASLEPA